MPITLTKTMTKIKLSHSTEDIFYEMSEGVPGAVIVLVETLKRGDEIDPDIAMGDLHIIMLLDELNIYGSKIWMLFKDVCKQNLSHMFVVVRAYQLGILTHKEVHHAIDNYGEGINIPELCIHVTARLPQFKVSE